MSQNEFSSARQNLVPETKKKKKGSSSIRPLVVAAPVDRDNPRGRLARANIFPPPSSFLRPSLIYLACLSDKTVQFFLLTAEKQRSASSQRTPRASNRIQMRRQRHSFVREGGGSIPASMCTRVHRSLDDVSREREFPTSEGIRSCTTADKVPVEVLMDSTNLSRFPSRRLIKVGNCRSRFETDTSIFSLSLL